MATDVRASQLWGVNDPMVSCTFGGKVYDTLSLSMLICIGNLPGDNAQTTKDSVVNLVLLKCRKLRREDQEKSDCIVSRILFIENTSCW